MNEVFYDLIRYTGGNKAETDLQWVKVLKKMKEDKGYAFLVY